MTASLPTAPAESHDTPHRRRILMAGATGTIGRATLRALVARGHEVVCLVRTGKGGAQRWPEGVTAREVDVTNERSVLDGVRGERFDAVVSCMASRSGDPADAWAIDHRAHSHLLAAARATGASHFVLLSAICVQKPTLVFQRAKLAFEAELTASGLRYSIVRPTAFFKSLAGQVERVKQGKPFLLFGDGTLTACTPISDDDLADYIAGCLDEPARWDRILPIGGPGPAFTPRQQGERLFALLGKEPKFKSVPVAMMDVICGVLGALATVIPQLRAKAEFARIGRYYATESMLVWDAARGRYDEAATPQHGTETLFDYYAKLVRGEASAERGEHAVF